MTPPETTAIASPVTSDRPVQFNFANTYARLPERFYARLNPTPVAAPRLVKLNTELAGVFGMISLNAIQIWSTLWIFIGFLFIYFIKGLALLGILFGATSPAALIIDMVSIATLHVSTLHWAISLLYSWQIQALAALWRLFR